MLAVPVFNTSGEQTGEIQVDPARFGGRVRYRLLKQAIVAYQDHRRQDGARTKGRSDVEGSTRKLYRQKGTGHARVGQIRNPIRRGGGRTFAKRGPGSTKELPKQMRRLARDSAILAKIEGQDVLVVEGLNYEAPKTKPFAAMLAALGADGGALLAMHELDRNIYLSGRNVPDTDLRLAAELNAYDVLRRRKLIFTRPAFERIVASERAKSKADAASQRSD